MAAGFMAAAAALAEKGLEMLSLRSVKDLADSRRPGAGGFRAGGFRNGWQHLGHVAAGPAGNL